MSPCPLCGYGISTFAISLDVEFIMCGNENCVYPFAEDSKVVRASLIDKRSPEAIASARKRKAQSFVPSDTKAITKKSKLDGQRKPAPPIATSAVPSSSLKNTLTKAISTTPIKPPSTLITRAPATHTAPTPTLTAVPSSASTAPSGVSTTPSEQFTPSDILSVDAPLAAEVGSATTRATDYTTSATWNDFLSSIPDFDIVTPGITSSAVPTAAQDSSSSRTAAKPAKLSVVSMTNFATPASTPLSSPTELLSASDLLSVDAVMTPLTASTNTPAATPTDSTAAEDAKEISDFLSSIPDFDTNATSNHSSNEALHLDEFHNLSLDFLHADPWTPPVTPPNQPLTVDTLPSKQSLDMSAANLESLLFGNDYEIAFDQEFSADLEAVLQG
ncbi:MAG: hypothetical protein J3R72DRAFT_484982 [Linnemannia gamsii]|nr:MAG: hypothetical protein J3R72DRAFT_484982 [Linnemannia gamsii]